jgi:hypothetical protein
MSKIEGTRVFPTTIDLHQAAATYDVATASGGDVLIEYLVFSTPYDLSDDAAFTGVTIQTNTTTAQTFIDAAGGAKALLTAESQIDWVGRVLLRDTDKIQLTIVGGTATVDPTTCPINIVYRTIQGGGSLV